MVPLFFLMAVLSQSTPAPPDDWISVLAKGSPYLLAVIIVVIVGGGMKRLYVFGWQYDDKVKEVEVLKLKVEQQNDVILDLLRKAVRAQREDVRKP